MAHCIYDGGCFMELDLGHRESEFGYIDRRKIFSCLLHIVLRTNVSPCTRLHHVPPFSNFAPAGDSPSLHRLPLHDERALTQATNTPVPSLTQNQVMRYLRATLPNNGCITKICAFLPCCVHLLDLCTSSYMMSEVVD